MCAFITRALCDVSRLEQCTCLCVNLLLIRVYLFVGGLKYVLHMFLYACMCMRACVWTSASAWPILAKPDQPGPLVTSCRHAAPVYRFPAMLYETRSAPLLSHRSPVTTLSVHAYYSWRSKCNAASNGLCLFVNLDSKIFDIFYPDLDYISAPGWQGLSQMRYDFPITKFCTLFHADQTSFRLQYVPSVHHRKTSLIWTIWGSCGLD
jgi:hypothetical protein